ncbi:exodeoxyribonuclease VII small subunit [Baaleninema simplex]|uniref:exodeoxyribonuclease VII small subunit n=1 Tax=Baaleninema simplex TaxID=2862350 RepID=UPI00034A3706|nr:exodeoxyribonuclease VII small subunit [Baaleninema simplex]
MSETWNYEATVDNIESIITRIESGDLQLEEVFEQFATATEQLSQCDRFLHEKQQQLDLSVETLEDGDDGVR